MLYFYPFFKKPLSLIRGKMQWTLRFLKNYPRLLHFTDIYNVFLWPNEDVRKRVDPAYLKANEMGGKRGHNNSRQVVSFAASSPGTHTLLTPSMEQWLSCLKCMSIFVTLRT